MSELSLIDVLFPKIRQGILAATLMHPERWWYMSDLARHLKVTPSSLQRELNSLFKAGILERRREGRQVYYRPDADCPILPELKGIMVKTLGLVEVLQQALKPFAKLIEYSFVFGSIARSEELGHSDIDLMIVSCLGLSEIAPEINKAEEQLGRSINPVVYTQEELAKKTQEANLFLQKVFGEEKLFVIGRQDDLAATFKV